MRQARGEPRRSGSGTAGEPERQRHGGRAGAPAARRASRSANGTAGEPERQRHGGRAGAPAAVTAAVSG
ncbi:hypothetical protein B8V81_0637 [Paenibacillus pasadenensis]|uniref:Uncharacterized protein n=1 Tax=Paenibacillus pasadenensis TaxID=217090 RepID=A0A2N5NBT2_9BACL|nr:hypothetical protein [Paenibacillus pasadenensis]PLT47730.1 hypothetical protein B8V81_0637 [Paenibacillus pasadenensis]